MDPSNSTVTKTNKYLQTITYIQSGIENNNQNPNCVLINHYDKISKSLITFFSKRHFNFIYKF